MSNVTPKVGDLLKSEAQTLVNTVNCVGIMGKGVALAFKKKFPEMYDDYVQRCERGEVRLGCPYLYKYAEGPWILNFPTKDHWRSVSKVSDIVNGMEHLKRNYRRWGITSLAVPPLGCGNGQLDWEVIGPTLFRHLDELDIPVELYAPHGTPHQQLSLLFLKSDQSRRRNRELARPDPVPATAVALVGILSRITREPYHWPIGRTTFQKIAYFANEKGILNQLNYVRGSYGPYARELKKLTAKLVNNGLVKETRRGNMYVVEPGPTYRDARQQYKRYLKDVAPQVEQVADLFLRFPRTTDAEIAATVHFVAKDLSVQLQHRRPTEYDVFQGVKAWKSKRNPPLDDTEVARAIRNLNVLRWVDLDVSEKITHQLPEYEEA